MSDKKNIFDVFSKVPVKMPAIAQRKKEEGGKSLFEPLYLGNRNILPQDLPYASEVEAALVRQPGIGARWLLIGVFLFFVFFVIWASFAMIDEVTHAEGQVVASSRTQVIQNLEGGILHSIEVYEGQIVDKGVLLASVDNEGAESSLRDMLYKAMEHFTAIYRLRTEFSTTSKNSKSSDIFALKSPENIKEWLENGIGHVLDENQLVQAKELLRVQSETFAVQMRQRISEIQVLISQMEQRQQEVEEQLARRDMLKQSLSLVQQQLNIAAPLVKKGSYSKVQYLELSERVVQTRGEIAALDESIPRSEVAAKEARHRIDLRRSELDSAIMDEINKRSLELASLREALSAGSDRVTRTELRSPVRGTVKKIYLNTVGGVVKPGEPVMEIVPLDDTLLVEARVRPQDVAFLHSGQKAMVKVSAYDFSIYGGLDGVLEQISADTIEDKNGNFYYLVKVRTPKTAIEHNGKLYPIMPGMMTTADIITGKKSVMDYLLKPILKAKQNALREK